MAPYGGSRVSIYNIYTGVSTVLLYLHLVYSECSRSLHLPSYDAGVGLIAAENLGAQCCEPRPADLAIECHLGSGTTATWTWLGW